MIIPAFAVGRVEEMLYWIKRLEEEKRIPVLPVFVDSPMAIEALRATPSGCASSMRTCSRSSATRRRRTGRPTRTTRRRERRAARAAGTAGLRVLHRAIPDDLVGAGIARS